MVSCRWGSLQLRSPLEEERALKEALRNAWENEALERQQTEEKLPLGYQKSGLRGRFGRPWGVGSDAKAPRWCLLAAFAGAAAVPPVLGSPLQVLPLGFLKRRSMMSTFILVGFLLVSYHIAGSLVISSIISGSCMTSREMTDMII